MAITTNDAILSMLKVYYAKDGLQNLMFRNDPVLKSIKKERVEGKVQNFSTMYGRGGAAGGNFTAAAALAATVSKNAEFSVVPGQLFSVYTMNSKEVQASKTRRGAYMKVAGAKMFAASESFRKTMAAAFYGSGYGEIAKIVVPAGGYTASTPVNVTLPMHAIMKIDVGSVLEVVTAKTAPAPTTPVTLTVNSINGSSVNVTPSANIAANTYVLRLQGSVDANGSPLLPMGLDGWLPVAGRRTGNAWTTLINTSFFGVNRSVAPDRLAGGYVESLKIGTGATATIEEKYKTLQRAIQVARRQGSIADLIVLNDEDWLALANEIQTTNTYFTQTSTKEKRKASVGYDSFSASFSTNYIESIVDTPYCPKGRFYVLDKAALEFWSYTNTEKLEDGVAGNQPGKPDPVDMDNSGKESDPYGLIIDDYLNIQPGQNTIDGPASQVTLQFFGSLAVVNPSVCVVGEFADHLDNSYNLVFEDFAI